MCGITGYWSSGGRADEKLGVAMAHAIAHRGPDGAGVWSDPECGVVLAHRRLAIIDLSEAGFQPMRSASGRFVVVFNGEIYNFQHLRHELELAGKAPAWRGHSDTEVMLAALDAWGVGGTLTRLNGMFAIALWDRQDRTLTLARDRMGEKPLYFGSSGRTFFFGSELKSFRPHPDFAPEINRDALSSFLRHNYVPGPASIYRGIAKLPPAHFLTIKNGVPDPAGPQAFWDIEQRAATLAKSTIGDETEALDRFEHLLNDSIKLRMVSDVPLGAFLSGGYDSSIVAAMMQQNSARPVKTFTIGFEEKEFNEADHARAVANHLGTDHTELYVTPKDALDVIPQLPQIYDEPFADSSQIPTFLLSKLTRQHVTVSLSGDGGDELFCGYNRYALGYSMWSKLSRLPLPLRQTLAAAALRTPRSVASAVEAILPGRWGVQHLAERLPKLAGVLAEDTAANYYRNLISHWRQPDTVVIGGAEPTADAFLGAGWNQMPNVLDRMMLADMRTYLPDDILVKVDRASMAVSLEARVPFLDHRLVEFAWEVPLSMKYRDGRGKWLLRQLLYKHVPQELMDRPKMGFGVPIDRWLVGPLREWAEGLLDERTIAQQGYLDPRAIRAKWDAQVAGNGRWHYELWDILMFQAWLEQSHPPDATG